MYLLVRHRRRGFSGVPLFLLSRPRDSIRLLTAIQAIASTLALRPILSCRVLLESGAHYQVIGLLHGPWNPGLFG